MGGSVQRRLISRSLHIASSISADAVDRLQLQHSLCFPKRLMSCLFNHAATALQVSDSTVVIAARVAIALFVTANALVQIPAANQPIGSLSILAAAIILLSPISGTSLEFARNFRLSEPLMQTCRDMSLFVAGPMLLLFALAVGTLRVLPVELPVPAQQFNGGWLAEAAAATDPGGC